MSDKKRTSLSSNQVIREAIKRIALRGVVKKDTGAVYGTGKIVGYVAKIHKDGKLAGTIDVQEYVHLSIEEDDSAKMGYHEGVMLSAIQDNSNGLIIIPKLYSEVVVTQDSDTGVEYVSMFSHVDLIQLDSHDTVSIGVREREEFDESDEDSNDVHELEETGVYTNTTYLKESIVTEVHGKDAPQISSAVYGEDEANHTSHVMDSEKVQVVVGDDKSSSLIDQEKIELVHDKSKLNLNDKDSTLSAGNTMVKVKDGTVYLGSDSGTDVAVLGVELAGILSDMLGYIGQVMTTTMMGPQPPLNIASFMTLKAQIEAFKSSKTGFLTQKVQIQK